jgi:hypothetical protein
MRFDGADTGAIHLGEVCQVEQQFALVVVGQSG